MADSVVKGTGCTRSDVISVTALSVGLLNLLLMTAVPSGPLGPRISHVVQDNGIVLVNQPSGTYANSPSAPNAISVTNGFSSGSQSLYMGVDGTNSLGYLQSSTYGGTPIQMSLNGNGGPVKTALNTLDDGGGSMLARGSLNVSGAVLSSSINATGAINSKTLNVGAGATIGTNLAVNGAIATPSASITSLVVNGTQTGLAAVSLLGYGFNTNYVAVADLFITARVRITGWAYFQGNVDGVNVGIQQQGCCANAEGNQYMHISFMCRRGSTWSVGLGGNGYDSQVITTTSMQM